MKIRTLSLLFASHLSVGILGVAIGIYILPILTAPPAPTESRISEIATEAMYQAQFKRELEDSDAFHWGEGEVTISPSNIAFKGELAPGPDYKLYLSNTFVETERAFKKHKSSMVRVGNVSTFENFVVSVSPEIDVSKYNTIIVWCEAFGEFITAAQYQK